MYVPRIICTENRIQYIHVGWYSTIFYFLIELKIIFNYLPSPVFWASFSKFVKDVNLWVRGYMQKKFYNNLLQFILAMFEKHNTPPPLASMQIEKSNKYMYIQDFWYWFLKIIFSVGIKDRGLDLELWLAWISVAFFSNLCVKFCIIMAQGLL